MRSAFWTMFSNTFKNMEAHSATNSAIVFGDIGNIKDHVYEWISNQCESYDIIGFQFLTFKKSNLVSYNSIKRALKSKCYSDTYLSYLFILSSQFSTIPWI